MTLPPRLRDTKDLDDLVRQGRVNSRQLGVGFLAGRYPPARPLRPYAGDEDGEDESDDLPIQFLNSDHATCPSNGSIITIPLTHVPDPGSEQVYYNGLPLKWSDWWRTDSYLVIPGEPWFRAGRTAWVDYAYYDEGDEPEITPPSLVNYTTVTTNHTSIPLPDGTQIGDLLILALSARTAAACSDPRFDAGYHHAYGGVWEGGIWVGVADASLAPVAITLDSTSADGGTDCCAALATFTGSPLTLTGDAGSSATSAPFTPTVPGSGAFGIAGLAMGSGLVSGSINDESTSTWATIIRVQGPGAGKTSVYLGQRAAGPASGTWYSTGGSDHIEARLLGVQ